MILSAIFPGLKFVATANEFQVNGSSEWRMWINSRAEGRFTQNSSPELAVIVANEDPHVSADQQPAAPWGSFLAILRQDHGRVQLAQKAFLFPAQISPLSLDVRIGSVSDFDHDNQDELLILTSSTRMGVSTTSAFLYQWNEQAFSLLWSAPIGEDNIGAINQPGYYASLPDIRLFDIDGDGIDEIVVNSTRIDYARDRQGLANLDQELSRRVERRVFHWDGTTFIPLNALWTPLPPLPTSIP